MSTFPGLVQPKRKRNPKALQLSAEALSPRSGSFADDEPAPVLEDADASSAAPPQNELSVSGSVAPGSGGSALGALSGGPTTSKISRKKPAGLDISRSIPTRPAPTPSTSSTPTDRVKRTSGPASTSSRSRTVSGPTVAAGDKPSRATYQQKLTDQLASLHLGGERGKTTVALRPEDLKVVGELGCGNGGTVTKVLHGPSGLYMARKLVLIDAKPAVRKQILRELQIMHDCSSDHIVSFYGAFLADPHICICMEHMDRGSLDNIYREHGALAVPIVGAIARCVLQGLTYLYDAHRIIHRDVKPSNILVNSQGQVKLCDFGVSGELINSIANTFVGTSTYMSPERIQGAQYTVKSDVWSLGISLIELVLGRFPFSDSDSDADEPAGSDADQQTPTSRSDKRKSKGVSLGGGGMTMSILDLLQHIVNEPAPRLPSPYGAETKEGRFVDDCLRKDPAERLSPAELLDSPWMVEIGRQSIDLKTWAAAL